MNGGGCINYIMEHVPFMNVEDEPRFHEIVNEWIKTKEVEGFEAFTKEPKAKRDRRHKKYAREFKESEKIKEKMKLNQQSDENDLAKQIMKRNEDRGKSFGSFLDKLAEKYGDGNEEDDDDEVTIQDLGRKAQKGKKKAAPKREKKETHIKAGRVSKRNK